MKLRQLLAMPCLALLAVACICAPALADPTDSVSSAGGLETSTLPNRYESLKSLGSSLTEEENVVIETRVAVLISANQALNESEVSFTGEVVGDIVDAGPGLKWANIMGSANNVISVMLTDQQAELIQNVGGYHTKGTSLKITGTYHIACLQHQGELDVHASSVEVIDIGGPVTHFVDMGRLFAAIGLCAFVLVLVAAFMFIRNRRERQAAP